MQKKLKVCSRQEPVILEQTSGGLRMHLQTGMYEAMRHAIVPYYGGEVTSNEVETSKTIVDATKKRCWGNYQEQTDRDNSLRH